MLRLREYRPVISTNEKPIRQQLINHPDDALDVDWVREKGGIYVEMNTSEEYWYVIRKDGTVIAIVLRD